MLVAVPPVAVFAPDGCRAESGVLARAVPADHAEQRGGGVHAGGGPGAEQAQSASAGGQAGVPPRGGLHRVAAKPLEEPVGGRPGLLGLGPGLRTLAAQRNGHLGAAHLRQEPDGEGSRIRARLVGII